MQPSFYAIAASTVRFFPGLSLLVAVQVRHITMSSKRVFFRGPFFFFFFRGIYVRETPALLLRGIYLQSISLVRGSSVKFVGLTSLSHHPL